MNNVIEYKGYWTQVEFSADDQVLYGKIEGISDLVNFECKDASGVNEAFKEAVDDYLAFCEDLGQEPNKPYKGTFNVRIPSALHRLADLRRMQLGISLNQLIIRALDEFIHPPRKETITTFVVPERFYLGSASMFKAFDNAPTGSERTFNMEVSYART